MPAARLHDAASSSGRLGCRQLVRGVQRTEVHFDFIGAACEHRRTAVRTKMPSGVITGFALDRHGILMKYRTGVEQRAMMLATVEAMTNTHPQGSTLGDQAHVAAQTTAGKPLHVASPLSIRISARKHKGHCCAKAPALRAILRAVDPSSGAGLHGQWLAADLQQLGHRRGRSAPTIRAFANCRSIRCSPR